MDFHDFPKILGNLGVETDHPPKMCASLVRGSPVEGGGLLLGLLERVRGLEAQQLRDLAAVRVVLEAPVPAGRRKHED